MVNYEKLAEFYYKQFPKISKEDHLIIIKGALDGKNPVMSKQNFINWYNAVGERFEVKPHLVDYIKTNPHSVMYRENMILNGDWMDKSLLEMSLK